MSAHRLQVKCDDRTILLFSICGTARLQRMMRTQYKQLVRANFLPNTHIKYIQICMRMIMNEFDGITPCVSVYVQIRVHVCVCLCLERKDGAEQEEEESQEKIIKGRKGGQEENKRRKKRQGIVVCQYEFLSAEREAVCGVGVDDIHSLPTLLHPPNNSYSNMNVKNTNMVKTFKKREQNRT